MNTKIILVPRHVFHFKSGSFFFLRHEMKLTPTQHKKKLFPFKAVLKIIFVPLCSCVEVKKKQFLRILFPSIQRECLKEIKNEEKEVFKTVFITYNS
jgi:hypothetical protein